ncbi:hypothetical protein [Streptomyces sp. NPDC005125]
MTSNIPGVPKTASRASAPTPATAATEYSHSSGRWEAALEHLPTGTLAVNAYTELADVAGVLDHNVVKVPVADDGVAVDTPEDLARAGILLA